MAILRIDRQRNHPRDSCTNAKARILLGGDVLAKEWDVVAEAVDLSCDVFLLSHHGATNAFCDETWENHLKKRARCILVSGASEHHPNPNIVLRLLAAR